MDPLSTSLFSFYGCKWSVDVQDLKVNPISEWRVQRTRNAIREIVETRQISRLYHFTRFENIGGILSYGLRSVDGLEYAGIPFIPTDTMRLDGLLSGISLSIHSLNFLMFEKKQRTSVGEWAVIELDAALLWELDCRFLWKNAASKQIRDHRGFLGGPWAFERMFSGTDHERQGKPDREPTDIQAEVQVMETISPDYVLDFTVRSLSVRELLLEEMSRSGYQRPVAVNSAIFKSPTASPYQASVYAR